MNGRRAMRKRALLAFMVIALGWPLCGLAMVLAGAQPVRADELADLKSQMAAMEERHQREIAQMQARLAALETQRQTVAGASQAAPQGLGERVDKLEETAKKIPAFERFAKINWSGDFRLRYDGTFNDDATIPRHRGRARLRLGAKYPVAEQLEFGARLATGGATGDSPYSTLGDRFNKDDFQLDQYYLLYRPVEGSKLLGGKFENPFWVTQATWDIDLQPEGAGGGYTIKGLAGIDEITATSAYFVVSESSGDHDAYLFGNQITLKEKLGEDWTIKTGLANYNYHKLSPLTVNTNATDSSGNYLSGFKILDSVSQVTYEGWRWPVSVLFDYGHNFAAAEGIGDDLYWVETRLGKLKKPLDWELKYEFAYVQQDATVADFAYNTLTPETNVTGHQMYATLRVMKDTDVGLNYLLRQRDKVGTTASTDENQWIGRVQLEVTTKF